MKLVVCVSGFLLLFFGTGVQLSPHPQLRFRPEGDDVDFDLRFSSVDNSVLYRVGGDGDLLLLINCSQPERPQADGYEVECVDYNYIRMSNLNKSHSGVYRAEGWRGGNITEHTSYRLSVCAARDEISYRRVSIGDSVDLCNMNSPLKHGSSLLLHQSDKRLQKVFLVLDTNSSLEPRVEDLKGRLQVDLNTSVITLSGLTSDYIYSHFYCELWRGGQCQSYSDRILHMGTDVFVYEEENVTLLCIAKGELPDFVNWDTNTGHGPLIINQTHTQKVIYNYTSRQRVMYNLARKPEVMYMLNNSQIGDYSLIIPSVSLQHTGRYDCRGSYSKKITDFLNHTVLYVCTKLSPLEVKFSPGQSVLLNVTEHTIFFVDRYGAQWYHQKVLQPQTVFIDFHSMYGKAPVSLPEELKGRVTVSTSPSNSSLIISNLTAEDSGLYTWRVYGEEGYEFGSQSCYEGSFRLVYLHPLGVHSPFYRTYAPLIGCVILGLVTAVIWFNLRSRRGEQTSGRQSREGQQSGDEDLYEEVEMAELNMSPSAVSD